VSEFLRVYIWNLGDSKTTLEELRDHLPPAAEPDVWFSNETAERFGLITFGATPPEALKNVRDLIGKEPEVAEEYEVEE
jgi:hypothetical protein